MWEARKPLAVLFVMTLICGHLFAQSSSSGSNNSPNGVNNNNSTTQQITEANSTVSAMLSDPANVQQINDCVSAGEAASYACNKDLQKATAASGTLLAQLQNLSAMSAQENATDQSQVQQSLKKYCEKMSNLSGIMSAVGLAEAGGCGEAQQACQKCKYAKRLLVPHSNNQSDLSSAIKACNSVGNTSAQLTQALQGIENSIQQSAQCASLVTDTPLDCVKYPTNPACLAQTDCSNSQIAATNCVCICNISGNNSAACQKCALNQSSYASVGEGAPAMPSDNGFGNASNGFGSNAGFDATGVPQTPQTSQVLSGDGGGGGFGGGNSKLLPPKGAGGGAAAASTLNTKINGGFMSPPAGGLPTPGAAGSPTGNKVSLDGVGKNNDLPPGVDLKQFLPKGYVDPKARILAGVSGPDGITGPYSDIWKKINIRYQALSYTLKK